MFTEDTRRAHRELEQRLRPFVARRVPPSDVEDVLQDVFLKMQSALPTLRDEERLVPWIYAVARNAIIDNLRQRTRQPSLRAELTESVESGSSTAEPNAVELELASYITSYVAQLPSPYREALTLTELSGMTQKAAAEALGVSLSGMKSRVQRGREKLRALLDACCRIGVDARGRVLECEPRDPGECRCRSS
jgi:RNA polymerase sigma-70 factor, ECF subfamily